MPRRKKYWLVKTEPEAYSIADLAREPQQTTCWDGVRNYQARNFLRDEMKNDDQVLIYHSSTTPPAVVGVAKVVREGYPDHTSWDPKNCHFDPQSTPENPRWYMIDLQLEDTFPTPIPIDTLRSVTALSGMELLRRGSRLSVQPVSDKEFRTVVAMAARDKSN